MVKHYGVTVKAFNISPSNWHAREARAEGLSDRGVHRYDYRNVSGKATTCPCRWA
jgi:hypothetical protein